MAIQDQAYHINENLIITKITIVQSVPMLIALVIALHLQAMHEAIMPFAEKVVWQHNTKKCTSMKVTKSPQAVGHLPQKISSTCLLFLRLEGTVTHKVTDANK